MAQTILIFMNDFDDVISGIVFILMYSLFIQLDSSFPAARGMNKFPIFIYSSNRD